MIDAEIFSPDQGPIYRETWIYLNNGSDRIIVEPWNAYSSLLFILGALSLYFYLRKKQIAFPFLQYIFLPLLMLGGLGSTLYHAFRAHRWIMWMDVMPMFVLTLSVGFYFWQKVTQRLWLTFSILFFFILLRMMAFEWFPLQTAINVSYAIVGIAMGLPVCWIVVKTHFYKFYLLFTSIVMLILSLLFRWLDDYDINLMLMGTHWLWHVFSVIGAIFAGIYMVHLHILEKNVRQHS